MEAEGGHVVNSGGWQFESLSGLPGWVPLILHCVVLMKSQCLYVRSPLYQSTGQSIRLPHWTEVCCLEATSPISSMEQMVVWLVSTTLLGHSSSFFPSNPSWVHPMDFLILMVFLHGYKRVGLWICVCMNSLSALWLTDCVYLGNFLFGPQFFS